MRISGADVAADERTDDSSSEAPGATWACVDGNEAAAMVAEVTDGAESFIETSGEPVEEVAPRPRRSRFIRHAPKGLARRAPQDSSR